MDGKEANSQQALNPITEGTFCYNTDDTMDSNNSYYAKSSHSHLPGRTDLSLSVNCHDQEYGEVGGSINNVCSTLIN